MSLDQRIIQTVEHLSLADGLAERLGVRAEAVRRWRDGIEEIPRPQKVQLVALLACVAMAFEEQVARETDVEVRRLIAEWAFQLMKLGHETTAATGDPSFDDEVVAEGLRVKQYFDRVRVAESLLRSTRH